jgi:hypothetical protein
MPAPTNSPKDERLPCTAVRDNGWRCDYVTHPGDLHVTWVNGWPQQWAALPRETWSNVDLSGPEVLASAPEALRSLAGVNR